MGGAALVLLCCTQAACFRLQALPPRVAQIRRRCSPLVAKVKRSAKQSSRTKPAADTFQLQAAMVSAMYAHRDLWDKDASRALCTDVYVRADGAAKFYFIGKAVGCDAERCDAPSAVLAQKRLILEHARLLRPELEQQHRLGKALQLWTAPANTELIVAQRKQALTPLHRLKLDPDLRSAAAAGQAVAGFQPEELDESSPDGFYVRLPDDGVPTEALGVKFASSVEKAQAMAAGAEGVAEKCGPVEASLENQPPAEGGDAGGGPS